MQGCADDNNAGNVAILLWRGDYSTTKADSVIVVEAPSRQSTTDDDFSVVFPSGRFRTLRLYRRISYNPTGGVIGKDCPGTQAYRYGGMKLSIQSITATATASGGGDTQAPTLSSSVPANSATNVAVSGTIVLTFSEAIASVEDSKFSLSGATIGTVAIDGTDSKKVNVPYSGAANEATVTLSVAADAVADAAGNKSAALDDISFTTVASSGGGDPTPTCEGLLFKLEMKTPAPSSAVKVPAKSGGVNGSLNLSDYVTLTNGVSATMYNTNSSAYDAVTTTPALMFKDNAKEYLEIKMNCELQENDIITFTNSKNREICFSATTSPATANVTVGYKYQIPHGSALIGKSTIYVFRIGSDTDIKTLTINRPYTVTLNAEGGTSAAKVFCIDGEKVVLPHAFKKDNDPLKYYYFKGWYLAATGGDPVANYYAAADDITLHAQYKDIPASGDLFTLTMSNSLTPTDEYKLPKAASSSDPATMDLLQYADIAGGAATLCNKATGNQHASVTTTPGAKLSGADGYVVIDLDFPLADGDNITGDVTNTIWFTTAATRPSSTPATATMLGKTTPASVDVKAAGLSGATKLYIWQGGSSLEIKSLTISRPVFRTITLEYADGTTADGSIQVKDGTAATKPADPTWAHHRFDGWYNGSDPYVWTSNVTSNLTLTAHWTQLYTVTYAKGEESATGDAPTQDELAAGEKFTVAANTFAYEGHDFSTWNDGSADVAPASEYTMGSANVTLTAQWITATTKVTVTYKDGETTLGSEEITINTGNPVGYATYQTRNLATFDGWYNDPDLAEGHKIADISTLTASANVNVYGKWNYQYASSTNIEQWTLTNGAGKGSTTKTSALISLLGTNNFASNLVWENGNIELDSLDDAKGDRNEPYLGLKVKSGGEMLDFRVANGQTVKVKFGAIKSTLPQVSLNGGDYANMSLTEKVWSYTATGNDYISIKTADANAVVFKQIMINEDLQTVTLPWRVTYDANGGTCGTASAIWSGAALILPDVTPADADHTFAGWYDEVSGGSLIGAAGASYTPTDNTTLHAHFAPVEYAVNYAAGDHGSGDMAAANVGWGTEYTAVANGFTPETGYIFAGWAVSGVDGVSSIAAGGSFTMPKNPVTLTALWEDNSKVAVIVETNVKYESLAAAIAAAETAQTVQLLQNIHQEDGVLINKSLTLDLNGKTFTVDNGNSYVNRAIKVDAGTGTVLIKDGTVDALSTEDHNGGCYGGLRIETGNVTCTNVTFKNYRIYGMGVKPAGGTLVMNECTVISEIGGGMEVAGGSVVLNNCTFTQTGFDTAHAWISSCLGIGHNANLTVNGGTYTSEHYSLYVFTSGGEIDVESGSFTGDIVNKVTLSSYPDAVGTINISGGSFEGVGGNPIQFTTDNSGATLIAISGGTFDAPVENKYCAPGYIPSAEVAPGVYTVVPKDGVEIIGVVTTGGTNKTVTGLYKGDASVNLDNNKKIGEGNKYIYVTLKEGYTFEENDVLIIDLAAKSDLGGGTKALEITTGIGNIDGAVWKSIAFDDYDGSDTISLEGIAPGQTSIGLKRSANQNARVNGIKVLRPMKPVLKKVTVAGVEGTPDNTNHVAIEVPASTADDALDAITYDWISNSDAWTAAHAPVAANAWTFGVENTVTLTDKDGDKSVYYVTISKAVPSSDATLATLTYGTPATAIALADGVFEYNVELPYGTSAVPTLAATAHHAGANVTNINNAAAFVNRHATSTVMVTAEDGTTTQLYTVNFTVSRFESKVLWDGSTMSALSDITAAAAAAGVTVTTTGVSVSSFSAKTCEENGKSYTKALDFGGKTQSTRNFGIVIPTGKVAKVSVVYRAKGTSRSIMVATALSDAVNESTITSVEAVDGSNLYIMTADMFGGGTLYINTTDGYHVHEISLQLADGFARSSMLGAGVLGTVCVPNNVAVEDIQGVTVYELMGRDYSNYGKLAFDEIVSGELEAGAPYVFQANGNHMALLYGETSVAAPVDKGNGMYGTFEQIVLNELTDVYYFAQRALWSCDGAQTLTVAANRAYVKLSEVGEVPSSSPNPGRRRILMTVNGEKVATDIDDVQGDNVQCIKVMIDGQLYILRGEKMYDATGRLVK